MNNKNKKSNKKILVIIPAFNEAGIIFNVVNEVKKYTELDYIVVNDNSYDSTELILKDNKLNYISNEKNSGLSETMRTGMKYALEKGYDACIQFDGDGKYDVNSIKNMITKYKQGYEIVLTSRYINSNNIDEERKEKMNIFRKMVWKIFIFLFEFKSKLHITDPTSNLRLYNKRFMEAYVKFKKFEVEPSTILYAIRTMDFRIVEIPTTTRPRITGTSSFNNLWTIIIYMYIQLRRMLLTTNFWTYHKKILKEK